MKVDLNADMGESFGAWTMGNDAALLDIVTSASVACGFHAGDPDVMARTMRMAVEKGVGIGAHPGFPDLQGFGRRRMDLPREPCQPRALPGGRGGGDGAGGGGRVRHSSCTGRCRTWRPRTRHGAGLLRGGARGAAGPRDRGAGGDRAAGGLRGAGLRLGGEIFADRAYEDDATLVDRRLPGAMIHDPGVAGPRVAAMVRDGAIHAAGGSAFRRGSTRSACMATTGHPRGAGHRAGPPEYFAPEEDVRPSRPRP
jgi:5-oxoprolinase (ATP-hydrolysing) subunit A